MSGNRSRPFVWETFAEGMDDFHYIAHLLDRVLVGRRGDEQYHRYLLQGMQDDTVLEIRLFNKKEERCAARVDGRMIMYAPLRHEDSENDDRIIDRFYKVEKGFNYTALHVKEYISIDDDHHAYVEKCVLYELIE